MIKRMIWGMGGLVAFILFGTWLVFLNWRSNLEANLRAGAELRETARGQVEYTLRQSGPVLAVLHGTPGGYDQVANAEFVPNGMSLLAISRPGYLRTPLSSGKTPEEQADLLAALFEELGIDDATILGISGGGPAAIQFALRHPEKAQALVLLSARTKSHPVSNDDDETSLIDTVRAILGTDFLIWLLGDRIARAFADSETPDEATMARLKTIVLSSALIKQRTLGRQNDVANVTDERIDAWPLDDIEVPTLIIYGSDDPGVSPAESGYAHRRIPRSKLVVLSGGHFIGATQTDRVKQEIAAFLETI